MSELNEKELQYIIREVSNSLLNEIKVMDAYQKYYSDVPSYVWEEIVGRLQKDRNGNFVNDLLPETKWVLKLYKAKSPRLVEDLYKLKNENGDGYLDIFLRAKERRMIQGIDGDLNRFKSIAELGTYVSSLDVDTILGRTKGEMSNAVHEAKDDIEKLYEDDEWIILIPKTHEASCYWAKGAHWCTAYRDSDDYFNEYSSQGPLFMNINKENPQLSTQFHLESQQYMDYYDNAIEEPIFEQIHDGDTLLDFYQGYLPAEKFIKMVGSELGNGLYAAYLYDYDYGEEGHDDDYAYFMVDINMNRIAGPFEDMYNFIGNDVTRVIYNDSKYNLVDTKGNLQFDEPLLDIRVCGDNKNKFIGRTCNSSSMDDEGNITVKETTHVVTYDNGKIQHFPQYDYYTFYHEGFSIVRGKDNFNILNYNFQPIFKDDYLYIKPFSSNRKQYFAIQKMNKWNLTDINGNILWDKWVYDITPNLTINDLPIKTFKVHTGIGLNLYDINGNPMMSEDVEKFTWSNWKSDGVVSGVMMLNGDYNFLDNKFNIIDGNGKILYKGLYEPMNENRNILNENYHGEIYHFTSLIQGSWIVDDDTLYANISQSDECEGVSDNRKYIDGDAPFISFTRDKNYSIQGNNRSLVCFVFDGDDIQKIRNARLYPFSFGGYGREESEERVYGVHIKPLHKYLKRIEIKLSNKPYSWSSDRQFDEEDDLYEEFETKYPELSQKEIDKLISDYLVNKITNNKLVGNKVVIKNNVNESRRILNEITVQDASKRFYSDIPANDFMEIINTLQGGNQILLPDTKWALALYKKKSPRFMEDLYKLHNENGDGYLDIFNRLKTINKIQGAEGDLGRYKSISELGAFINAKMNELGDEEIWGDNTYRKKKNMSDDVKSAKDDIKVLYEDDTWLILTPKSYEASVYWGDGTEWCTAYKDDRKYYDRYSKEGILYININKKTGEKFQFHFESNSFMDADDSAIDYDDSPVFDNMQGITKGMEDFYANTVDSWDFQYLTGYNKYNVRSFYDPDERAYYLVKRGSDKPVSDYYDEIGDFADGYAIVYKEEKAAHNFINSNGELLSEVWFYDCYPFSYGYAAVSFGLNEWNYINTNGEWLLKKDVQHAMPFFCGLGKICYDNKYNLVDTDGKIISKTWFDEIGYFNSNSRLIKVCLHNKYNFIKKDGELISEQWWDVASSSPIDGDNFTVANYSDGIIYYVNKQTCEINKSDENLQTQSELSRRAFWENTQKLDINDIHYIINEAKERLLLNEISNNAIETLFKKYIPWVTEIFDLTLKEVRSLGKRPGDTREGIYGLKGAAYCNELGIVNDDINNNPEMKIKDWLRLKIMKEFEINRGRGPIQFIRGIIRICCIDDDISLFSKSTTDMTNQNTKLNLKKFKQIIGYIMSKNLNFNEDLNGLKFKELNRSIGAKLRHEAYDNWIVEKDKRNGVQQVGEYQVIPMYGFEDTSKYCEYTSWCVTQRRSHYDQYTSDGSQFFFCLKDGFEDVKDEQGENCPLDEYGLSMVSVLVRSNGEIKHVTTRWNHDNNGEDNPQLRTFEQIEEVLGIPESLFTVNIAPELDFEDIPELIQKHGIDKVLRTITNVGGFKIVEYNRKRNVIYDNKLLSDKWFDCIETTDEGFFQCINNDHRQWEYNIIDKKGLVFPENFPHARFRVYNPDKDLFIVCIAGESALYKRGSNFAISEKFMHITKIHNGYARADNYGYYNFYDENGKKTWDEWKTIKVYDSEYWSDGFQRIFNNYGRSNFINIKTGEILLDEWYLETSIFHGGTASVKNENGLYNFVKTDGTLVSEKWYESMIRAGEYYVVKIGEGETFLDKNGQYPIKKTWKHAINFNGNYGLVRHDDNDNITVIVDKDGNEVADVNMNCVMITNGNAIVAFNKDFKVSLFDINGNYLLPPNLKLVTSFKQNKMKENFLYFENEQTGIIYELNLENSEITEINR